MLNISKTGLAAKVNAGETAHEPQRLQRAKPPTSGIPVLRANAGSTESMSKLVIRPTSA